MADRNIQAKFGRRARKQSTNARVQVNEDLFISRANHDKLLKHIKARLDFGNTIRDDLIHRFEGIDKELSGHVVLDQEDKERDRDNKRGKPIKPVDMSLPLTLVQIDEAVTYTMSVVAPDGGMYNAVTDPERQDTAQGLARYMNEQAAEFKHYISVARACRDMYAYNLGGLLVEWKDIEGNSISNNQAGGVNINREIQFSGNDLIPIDPYNFIWDITTDPVKLHTEGEFFATIEPRTKFKIARMVAKGEIYNATRFLQKDKEPSAEVNYYELRPDIQAEGSAGDRGNNPRMSWQDILSQGQWKEVGDQWEQINYYGWIKPSDFGLSESEQFEIWRVILLTDKFIVKAEPLTNAHEKLPVVIGMPWDDGFGLKTRSFADLLLSLNRFASFQLNIHQRASRKALYGVTFYDADRMPLTEGADMVAAKIPVRRLGKDGDLRKFVEQFTDVPDTSNTLQDVSAMEDIMQKVLPTDILSNITNLERATLYQAAATVQGSNRRAHKITKTIDDQALSASRSMMLLNVLQFGENIEVMDEEGNISEVDVESIRDKKIRFGISEGLKGIDRLIVTEGYKEIIGMVLQSQFSGEIDILKLIDHWADLIGDKTDFNVFRIKNEFDALTPEQKQQAFALLQQASAEQEAPNAAV